MSRRARLLAALAVVAAAVAVVVVVLVLREDDDHSTLRGDVGAGFPLRGSLKDDDDAVDGAVGAWRDQSRDSSRLDDEITALWIGRIGPQDVAILSDRDHVAEVLRGP